jgi:hypothetical protein
VNRRAFLYSSGAGIAGMALCAVLPVPAFVAHARQISRAGLVPRCRFSQLTLHASAKDNEAVRAFVSHATGRDCHIVIQGRKRFVKVKGEAQCLPLRETASALTVVYSSLETEWAATLDAGRWRIRYLTRPHEMRGLS